MDMLAITLAFRGQDMPVQQLQPLTTCGQLAQLIQEKQQPDSLLAPHTLKLLVSKQSVALLAQPDRLLRDIGVQPGHRYVLLGSYQSELQALESSQAAEASLRLPDFDYEARRTAARSTTAGGGGGTGKHFFGSFKVIPPNPSAPPSAPTPSAAMALLHKLATDPAIAAVMERHGWKVPLLSEMPPEGRVGVSAVCILGYNVNKGQEISLRLRTDDWAGFRYYLSIRRTLVHELTHNVWGEHNNNFKQLNSQLLSEVAAYEATHGAAARTAGGIATAFDPAAAHQQHHQQQQQPRGHTLAAAVAAGAGGNQQQQMPYHRVLPAAELARAAALARWHEQGYYHHHQQQQQQEQQQLNGDRVVPAAVVDAAMATADAGGAADGGAAAAAADYGDLQQFEHEDPQTAAAEAAAERLGSLDVVSADEDTTPQVGAPAAAAVLPISMQQRQPLLAPLQQHHLDVQLTTASTLPGAEAVDGRQGPPVQPANPLDAEAAEGAACVCCQQNSTHEHAHGALPSSPVAAASSPAAAGGGGGNMQHDVGATSGHDTEAAAAAVGCGSGSSSSSTSSAAAAAGADGGNEHEPISLAEFEGLDPLVASKLKQAGQLAQELRQQSAPALQTLADVLRNVAVNPQEQRYRRLRVSNAAFHRRLGQYPSALQLLQLAGFAQRQEVVNQESGGGAEPVLVYVRSDPGLVYLVLSVVSQAAAATAV